MVKKRKKRERVIKWEPEGTKMGNEIANEKKKDKKRKSSM